MVFNYFILMNLDASRTHNIIKLSSYSMVEHDEYPMVNTRQKGIKRLRDSYQGLLERFPDYFEGNADVVWVVPVTIDFANALDGTKYRFNEAFIASDLIKE